MDVARILEADHRQAEDLFAQIEGAEGKDRQPFIEELATALRAHMELEEQVVYRAMEPVTGHESVRGAETERGASQRKGLDDMVGLTPTSPGSVPRSTRSRPASPTTSSEAGGVPEAAQRRHGAALEKMSTPFMKKRMELGMPMEADAIAAASTKDELLAEAKAADVEAAAAMNKEELAEALAGKMA